MARGGFPGGGNIQQMIKQAQQMQRQLAQKTEEIGAKEFEASSGGGAVIARMNGKKELLALTIKPEAVDPEDVEMLQDMILAAVNEVLRAVADETDSEIDKITGGLPFPL